MVRKFREVRSLERNSRPKRKPKPEIVVVCEGKLTEPEYFKGFSRMISTQPQPSQHLLMIQHQ